MKHILIIGGGTGGIMTAAQLLRKGNVKVTVLEPAEYHYYQPAWTLVGANTYDFEKTKRTMASVMPDGVNWIKEYAESFEPENNTVITKNGTRIEYDFLVLSPGIKIDNSLVKGLEEAIDKGVVCSNYTDPKFTWKVLKNFKGGTALFTQPATPIKCGGAPQKIMYLAEDHFKKAGIRDKTNVVFATPGSVIFGVKPIAKTLMEVVDRKDINLRFHHKLVEVDGKNQIAWYEITKEPDTGGCVIMEDKAKITDTTINYNRKDIDLIHKDGRYGIKFDMLHLAPPQTAPDFIKNSVLANDAGWIDVNIGTLQHNKFANIFGIGDAAALPTAKTGAAIRKQVPIVVENISRLINAQAIGDKEYNGYSSCPLVTGYGKMVLAEFDYDSNFTPDPKLKRMFISDSSKEHRRLWWLKKYILPYLYWKKMLKGIDV
ncbi:MAG: pyridine nucleotide-disulfide oxidoreductase [Bacteroidetes bacterium]|nr:MAG: pyridine nucleotide-disulfide oxidoreductase [Bacteroidota bacterium]